jgi:hypothetical protein
MCWITGGTRIAAAVQTFTEEPTHDRA